MQHSDDLVPALGLAVAALAVGSIATGGTLGNLALLLGGVAGALVARWHVDGRVDPRLATASAALCACAGTALVASVARTPTPHADLLVATVAALMATALSMLARSRIALPARPDA